MILLFRSFCLVNSPSVQPSRLGMSLDSLPNYRAWVRSLHDDKTQVDDPYNLKFCGYTLSHLGHSTSSPITTLKHSVRQNLYSTSHSSSGQVGIIVSGDFILDCRRVTLLTNFKSKSDTLSTSLPTYHHSRCLDDNGSFRELG